MVDYIFRTRVEGDEGEVEVKEYIVDADAVRARHGELAGKTPKTQEEDIHLNVINHFLEGIQDIDSDQRTYICPVDCDRNFRILTPDKKIRHIDCLDFLLTEGLAREKLAGTA